MTALRSALDSNRWVWSRTRRTVMVRDRQRCQLGIPGICTTIATEVDHILPRALKGGDTLDNLRAVCHSCHIGRGMDESSAAPARLSYGASRVVTRRY